MGVIVGDLRVSVQPGPGVVAHIGGAILLVMPEGPGHDRVVDELLAIAEGAGRGSAPTPALARRLGALVATAEDGSVPPFGVVGIGSTDGDVAVFLHGSVELRTSGADETLHLSGRDATTWVDRIIAGSFDTLALGPAGQIAAPRSRVGDLRDGIVTGSGVVLTRRGSPPEPVTDVVPLKPVPLPPTPEPAAPEPAAVAAEPEPPAAAPAPPSAPPSEPGWFVLDTGASFRLDRSYVLGRAPEDDSEVESGLAQPILLDDPERLVSRVHARIVVNGDVAVVLDAGSANGTFVADLDGEWARIEPGAPHPITPGARVRLGERSLIVEGPRPTEQP